MHATCSAIGHSARRSGLFLFLTLIALPLVGAVHDAPVSPARLAASLSQVVTAVDDAYDVVEGTTLTVAAPGVMSNDTGATSVTLVSGPASGTLQLNPDGSFSYTHNGLSTTPVSFVYSATDGSTSDQATVTLNVSVVSFGVSALANHATNKPTSLQFGPDSLLYVQQKVGQIRIMKVVRDSANAYRATSEEVVTLLRSVPNYNDDGVANAVESNRQATGLLVTGTASNPVIYASSSDPRVGGNQGAQDTGLDTNSGVISRLTWNGTSRTDPAGFWERVDIVRGLPRSEENHATNGLALSLTGDTLFVAVGGFTNAGAPSNNFAFITEYAYAAAIVGINLPAINALPTLTDSRGAKYKYNMPTLDDPTRANVNGITDPNAPGYNGIDVSDPWGGNDGLNQAKIVPGEPVFLHSTGWRNPYDVVVTRTPGREGRMYAIDNGANGGWGGHPINEGMAGVCTNQYDPAEPGGGSPGPNDPQVNNEDNLHLISTTPADIFYAGHPAPVRGNPAGAGLYTGDYNADPLLNTAVWRDGSDPLNPLPADWPPVPVGMANPEECDYRSPGDTDGALSTFFVSTNGFDEYTASNFNNKFKGDLFAAGYNNNTVYYIDLNEAGDQVLNNNPTGDGTEPFFENFGSVVLDVAAQGDDEPFPGTMWVADFTSYDIWVFEPGDYEGNTTLCTGVSDPLLDEDGDGFDNEDETINGTNVCSAASKPADNDGDLTSDLLDADDDNDTVADVDDAFATDATNGSGLTMPVVYPLLNEDPGTGFFGVGFTGLMTNGTTDYLDQYELNNLIPGGTAGLFTISAVDEGDATGATNTQAYAFQFGVNVSGATGPYTVKVKMPGPFFDSFTPQDDQAQGMFIGTGDMDNYVKLVLNAQGGDGGLQVVHEGGGVATVTDYVSDNAETATNLDLLLTVDPVAGTVQPRYYVDDGIIIDLGLPITVSGDLLAAIQGTYQVAPGVTSALAVGIISTSAGAGPAFAATWDAIDVYAEPAPIADLWHTFQAPTDPRQRHENTFVKHSDGNFYLIGGRGSRKTERFNPTTGTWTALALPPVEFHHFQAVSLGSLIYVIGAYVGTFPSETPVANLYTYNPASDTWTMGGVIPPARQRGSAGLVAYDGNLYLVSGSLGGHSGTAVYLTMFDQYNPNTGIWTTMPDIPRGRDHFNAAVVGDKLYVAGGRAGSVGATIEEVDIYDFVAGTWSTLPAVSGNIPTPRGGTASAVVGNDLFIIGGESALQTLAHNEVEVLDTSTNSWRTLDALNVGRHGTAAVVDGTKIFIAAGSGETGGGPELGSMEVFERTSLSDPGTVLPSTLAATPTSLDFGPIEVGLNDAQMVFFYNTGGNQNISVSGISVSGDADFSVSYTFALPAVLAPGDSLEVDVTYAPSAADAAVGTLTVVHNGANGSVNVPLSGSGFENGGGIVTGDPIYRVNAGGSNFVDALLDWDRDTKNIPSPYVNASGNDNKTGKVDSFTGTNTTDAPVDVLTKNRWDPTGGVEMIWSFPVSTPGLYQAKLYFLETDPLNYAVGGRVFDIRVEGQLMFEDFDIFAEAGANTALMKSVVSNVADGTLNIELVHVIDNPIIQALEIRPVLGAALFASPASLDFFSVPVGSASAPLTVTYTNTSTGSVTVTGVSITGLDAAEFGHDFTGPVVLNAAASDSFEVTMTPTVEGVKNASLEIVHSGAGSPVVIALTGEGTNVHLSFVEIVVVGSGSVMKSPDQPLYPDGTLVTLTATPDPGWEFSGWSGDLVSPDNPATYTVFTDATITATFIEASTTIDPIFRVNAGNGSVSDTPIVWDRDTKNKPSSYSNASTGGDNSISKAAFTGVNNTDAPTEVFGSNRWDPAGNTDMEWNFPVGLAGDYVVNLYFAETGTNTNDIGERVFDVVIENNLVLNDFDAVADAGYQTAIKKSFVVAVTDGNIDINFLRVVDNPFVSAIEIVPTPATVPAEARYNGVDNTFIVRRYQQAVDGAWALVGLPLQTESGAAATIVADEMLQFVNGAYVPATQMTAGRGFWVRAEEEQLTTLQGTRFDTMTVAVRAGWNLIAGPSCDAEFRLLGGADRLVPNTLFRFDSESGYRSTDRLEQGRGYWVRAVSAGAVFMDCGSSSAFLLPVEPNDLSTFGRVAIADAEGRSQALYFGGQIDEALLPQYSMPSQAPGQAFDVRFSDDSRLVKPTTSLVRLQNVAFPLNVTMEALPEGGHDNEYVVTTVKGETEVESRRVRAGGVLTIEDEVDALKIQSLSDWQSELPAAFGLKGNYPNPFNPVTQIVFDLPAEAEVNIDVFDLLGRRVRQLGTYRLAAGTSRQIEMDGGGLASGVYLYRVEAVMASQTVSDTGKMILVK